MSGEFVGSTNCADGCCFDYDTFDTLAEAMASFEAVTLPGGIRIARDYMGHQGWWIIDDLLTPVKPFVADERCQRCGRLWTIGGRAETVVMSANGFQHGVCDDRWDT